MISAQISLVSRILNWGFRRYVRRFVRQNFNAVRVAGQKHLSHLPPGPFVCFVNHPGWWDPMTVVLLTDQLFPGRRFAAPMDAEALKRYPTLGHLGFFPIARDSVAGAKEFLKTGQTLLKSADTIMWLSPTGKFNDVREATPFMQGLGHLVERNFAGSLFPMAIEYTFWNERSPELLVQFGAPIDRSSLPLEREQRTRMLEESLAQTQASLAQLSIARDPSAFTTVMIGKSGIGGVYDAGRRLMAWVQGKRFQGRHSDEKLLRGTVANGEVTC